MGDVRVIWRRRVDGHLLWWHRPLRWPVEEVLGMRLILSIKCGLSIGSDSAVALGGHLLRGKAGERAGVMLGVVPVDVVAEVNPGMVSAYKAPRVVGLALGRFELALTVGVVVGYLGRLWLQVTPSAPPTVRIVVP